MARHAANPKDNMASARVTIGGCGIGGQSAWWLAVALSAVVLGVEGVAVGAVSPVGMAQWLPPAPALPPPPLPPLQRRPPLERASKRIAESSSAFSVDLIRGVLGQKAGNIVLSPLSASSMMAMVAQGAAGNSSVQLESALRASAQELRDGFRAIVHSLKSRKTRSSLELGSAVFVSPTLAVSPSFREQLYSSFHASIERVDFSAAAAAARAINRWVATATRGRIPDLVSPAAIRPRTRLVLANAVFFRGVWARTFDANKTTAGSFWPAAGAEPVNAPFMHQAARLRGGEDPSLGAKWVELPFDGEEFSMVVVLPLERHALGSVMRRMGPAHLTNMLSTRTSRHVLLSLPRFRLASALSLLPALQELGIRDIFDCRSDLSAMVAPDVPESGPAAKIAVQQPAPAAPQPVCGALVVADVIHKAQLEVNEEGSSASAASAVLVNTLSLNSHVDDLIFTADHPFLAIIVDKVNGLPLFAGRVANPVAT